MRRIEPTARTAGTTETRRRARRRMGKRMIIVKLRSIAKRPKMKLLKCYDKYKVLFTISIVFSKYRIYTLKSKQRTLVITSARNVVRKKRIKYQN